MWYCQEGAHVQRMCVKPYVEMEDELTDSKNVRTISRVVASAEWLCACKVTMATPVGAMVVIPHAESRLADGRVSLEVA